jgi:hypothetical protein
MTITYMPANNLSAVFSPKVIVSWRGRLATEQSLSKFNTGAWLLLSVSRQRGTDDRVPEERTKKSNYNNAEDEASRVGTKDLVVRGNQPDVIAHAKLSVARQRANLTRH